MEPDAPLSRPPVYSSAPGAYVNVLHTERVMKTYAFTEGELRTIGLFSGVLNLAIAGGGAVLGALLSSEMRFEDLVKFGSMLLVCLGVGVWAAYQRGSEIDRIKDECKTTP